MKNSKSGQVALEYILVTGAVFVVITAIFIYALTESNHTIRMNKASQVVTSLAKTADTVYALGPGSQDVVEIDMPGAVQQTIISGKRIILKIKIFGNISEVSAETKGNVSGTLPSGSGIFHIYVKALENNVVQISQ